MISNANLKTSLTHLGVAMRRRPDGVTLTIGDLANILAPDADNDAIALAATELRDRHAAALREQLAAANARREAAEREKAAEREALANRRLAERAELVASARAAVADTDLFRLKHVVEQHTRIIETAPAKMAGFATDLAINPGRAMEMSSSMFALAATVELAEGILQRVIGAGPSHELLGKIRDDLTRQLLSRVASSSVSTSETANLMEAARSMVIANVARELAAIA